MQADHNNVDWGFRRLKRLLDRQIPHIACTGCYVLSFCLTYQEYVQWFKDISFPYNSFKRFATIIPFPSDYYSRNNIISLNDYLHSAIDAIG